MFTVFFWAVIAVAFLSSPVYAFWYGYELEDKISFPFGPPGSTSDIKESLDTMHDLIDEDIGPALEAGAVGTFMKPYAKEGFSMWNKSKAYNGYTLLSSFTGYQDESGIWNYAYLIDMEGKIVKAWPLNPMPAK